MPKIKETWVVLISMLAAMLLASHQLSENNFGLIFNYLYWIFRVLIEAGVFVAVLIAVERYLGRLLPEWGLLTVVILTSLIPFALAITAFDLVVGLPELGLNDGSNTQTSTAVAFSFELIYLLDNHVVLCLMILLPRLLHVSMNQQPEDNSPPPQVDALVPAIVPNTFIESLAPPLRGDLSSVEAQEHYVQVVTTLESRMVLYRFSDVVRQLSESEGMQVHRSHWVAHSAVKEVILQGQAMKLELFDGRSVPVSRTFRSAVESRKTLTASSIQL